MQEEDLLLAQGEDLLLVQEEDLLLAQEEVLLAQEENLLPAQEDDKEQVTRKVEDGQKTVFLRIVRGPLWCHMLSSLVPKSRFRGSGKTFFFKQSFEVKKDAELPPEYFPCGGSA